VKKIFSYIFLFCFYWSTVYALDTIVVADSVTGVASRVSTITLTTVNATELGISTIKAVTTSTNTLTARTANVTTTLTAATVIGTTITANTLVGSAFRLHTGVERSSFESVGVSFNRSLTMNVNGTNVMFFYYVP